jgi:hypothetical protein
MKGLSQDSILSRINDLLASRITMLVSSIWAFYAFVIFGLTPLMWPGYEEKILYWSNFLQLIFLPAITVGTAILNRGAQAQAAEDHETIRRQFALLQEAHDVLGKSLHEIGLGMRQLLLNSRQDGASARHATGDSGDTGSTA